jgi:hypothetical protein
MSRRFVRKAKETQNKYMAWGVWDTEERGWAIFYKDGTEVGGTALSRQGAGDAADRLEMEKDDVGHVAVPPTDDLEEW